MKIYFDTEFIEDGRTIELLSIGLVREDGETYYSETDSALWYSFNRKEVPEWIRVNVLPHLNGPFNIRKNIAREIIEFAGPNPEFWAYYADYDWVALCQLYGRMIDLPEGWPMYCRDVKQEIDDLHLTLDTQTKEDGPEHHALSDARWLARVHGGITSSREEIK